MFYSQIILAKKGPLGQVWQAAHWGAKKLGRPAVFSTDIAAITTSIANPTVPMALRVSGHLLLGIVRIYSRQVQFLLDDCHQAMIKVKMAYSTGGTSNSGEHGGPMIDITLTTRGSIGGSNSNAASNASKATAGGNNALNISNFGEYNDAGKGVLDVDDYYNTNVTTTHFAIPLEELLQRASDVSGMEHTDDDWVPAELDDSTLHISSNLMNTQAENTLHQQSQQLNTSNFTGGEEWGVFDPDDGEGDEEEDEADEDHNLEGKKKEKEDDGSATQYSDIEVTRAVNDSTTSDQVRRKIRGCFGLCSLFYSCSICSFSFYPQIRRASILQNNESGIISNISEKGGDSVTDMNDFPVNLDDDDHQNVMMDSENDNDDDDSELARRRHNRHSLRLSDGNDETNNHSNEIGISFDTSTDSNIAVTEKPSSGTGKRQQRPRKRRKITTDDGRTELSSDHIRSMIADTSDICRNDDLLHPATWIDPKPSSSSDNIVRNSNMEALFYDYSDMNHQRNRNVSLMWNAFTPQERLFCRPALGDDGNLSSELLELWTRNCAPVMNRPFPYELALEENDEEVEPAIEEIEQAREHRDDNSEILASDQQDEILGGNDPSFEMEEGNDNAIPFDDDDDRMPMPDDDADHMMASESTLHLSNLHNRAFSFPS